MILPVRVAPANNQRGLSSQRMSAAFFNDSQGAAGQIGFAALQPLPKTLTPSQTLDTEVINVTGFNTFMVFLDALTNAISFRTNIISVVDGVTVLTTRTIGTAPAGGGLTILNFGFGNTGALGGADVFILISLRFVNTSGAGNAVINQFPGLWGQVR